MSQYYSHGKLLLFGEYLVLYGAKALALPCKYGQSLEVEQTLGEGILSWKAFKINEKSWFTCKIDLKSDLILESSDPSKSERLLGLFRAAKSLGASFCNQSNYHCVTRLEFPTLWGLGTSSTLVYNLSSWLKVDPYQLLSLSFGGSGYDIACAKHSSPIYYALDSQKKPLVSQASFAPKFSDRIFFVYLNQKRNSQQAISEFLKETPASKEILEDFSSMAEKACLCQTLEEFETLIEDSESKMSKILKTQTIKEKWFSNYNGSIKSLGAWGGDFILVTGEDKNYFVSKGYKTILDYNQLILG
ncbi:MAG: GHMP kinase [Flavobacteriaceae bacterium]|nr:MAG: GHMP kinase [Flavobacteriaceae bacterium]